LSRVQSFHYIIISSIILVGCAVGPDYQSPEPPKVKSYTRSPFPQQTIEINGQEEKTQEFVYTKHISRQWWNLFESASLNQLIDRGLRNSPTLQAAQAALSQAEENLKAGMGGFFPSIDAQGTATRQKLSGATFGSNTTPPIFNLYNVSLNVSYKPDIFGLLRRQVEALDAEVDHKRFELEATYLALTSNIVTTAIREASLRAQIEVTRELITFQEQQLQIVRSQRQLGGASQTDLLAQETLVFQTKATLPPLESSLAQTQHALATLIGEFPSEASLPQFALEDIHLPTQLPITLPSSLVQHRPDIKAAEALLHQANAQIGVARANMFPQLVLTGNVGDISNQSRNLFASSSNVWSIASQLLQPIFRGGSMIAKENAAMAAYDQAFAQYRQTVLQAFQQVADVLRALVEDAKTHKSLVEAEKAASRSLEISKKQYQLGAISFLNLLNAQRQYQQTRIGRIQAEATRYADTAALFQALGGDCFAIQTEQLQAQALNPEESCSRESTS
jgi:NodT family efflux transporter outer membrane factor (OMF) lipoprotein